LQKLGAVLTGTAALLHDFVQLFSVEDNGEKVHLALGFRLILLRVVVYNRELGITKFEVDQPPDQGTKQGAHSSHPGFS